MCTGALAALANGCGPAGQQPSIVIVVIDTLRADHLGMYGYEERPTSPNLDERAASAAVFEHAYTTAPWTLPAFGSLLTGQLPTRHGAGVILEDVAAAKGRGDLRELVGRQDKIFFPLDPSLPTLASRLTEAGYDTGAIVNNAFLSPEFGIDRGFSTYDYRQRAPARNAETATDLALAWLDTHDAERAAAPFMLLVHYFDPHMPYSAPEPFQGRFSGRYLGDEFTLPLEDMRRIRFPIRDQVEGWERYAALEIALYDEEIAYTDHELERLLEALDRRGFWDNGVLVVTSDHGEEFHDHDRFEHGHTVYEELIHVPLMVWGPGVEAGHYDVPVSIVDVMPTLLAAAGVAGDAEFAGESLSQVMAEGPATSRQSVLRFDRPLVAERTLYGDEKKALIRWPWKMIADIDDSAQVLFDLAVDPGEVDRRDPDDLDEQDRDRFLSMLAELQTMMLQADVGSRGQGASLSAETLRTLRNLGYLR